MASTGGGREDPGFPAPGDNSLLKNVGKAIGNYRKLQIDKTSKQNEIPTEELARCPNEEDPIGLEPFNTMGDGTILYQFLDPNSTPVHKPRQCFLQENLATTIRTNPHNATNPYDNKTPITADEQRFIISGEETYTPPQFTQDSIIEIMLQYANFVPHGMAWVIQMWTNAPISPETFSSMRINGSVVEVVDTIGVGPYYYELHIPDSDFNIVEGRFQITTEGNENGDENKIDMTIRLPSSDPEYYKNDVRFIYES